MNLRSSLRHIGQNFPQARLEPMRNNPVAKFITTMGRDALQETCGPDFLVTASPGRGNWAEIPWLAVFDPRITTTAQRGIYVVYLFSAGCDRIYLSLNQGTTEVRNLVGAKYLEVLRYRADADASLLLPNGLDSFSTGPVNLDATGDLGRGY